jgi:hypothetical protein
MAVYCDLYTMSSLKMKESTLRKTIAINLALLDSKLKLVAEEHYIKMSDGRKAYIDILAKDDFGCFTVIELKKSNQTARSAIQQLFKYASFLKRKNRLEENQIRCIIISTVWDELEAPFSEFSQFPKYEIKGYLLDCQDGKLPAFSEVKPEYKEGNLSPLNHFIFFEFSNSKDRDAILKELESILRLIPSVNSVVIKTDYDGDDVMICHPFGFAWIMFTGDVDTMNSDMSRLEARSSSQNFLDSESSVFIEEEEEEEEASPEDIIMTKILLEHIHIETSDSEYNCLTLHSLNNILSTWNYSEPKGLGVMFDDALFDSSELVSLSCGFIGDHPYNFVAKTTPSRPKQFLMIRKKLNKFLLDNERWRKSINHILDEVDDSDVVDICIYNPLNLFGMINDVYKTAHSKRIPKLKIIVKNANGTEAQFCGELLWREKVAMISPEEAVKRAYGEIDFLFASFCHGFDNKDVALSESYGLIYEVVCGKGLLKMNDGFYFYEDVGKLQNLQDFLDSNDELIDQVGSLYSDLTIGGR